MEVPVIIAIAVFSGIGFVLLIRLDNLASAINPGNSKSRFMIGTKESNLELDMVYEILVYDEPTNSYILKKCPELIWHKKEPPKQQDSSPA